MRAAAILLVVLALTACGGKTARSPESVARAWSAALDKGDADAAAKLFAPGAEVVQDDVIELDSHSDAVEWNDALPCGGRITRVVRRGRNEVLVVFHLTQRPGHQCDAPGADAAAIFHVEHGKITLWHQTAPPGEGSLPPQPTV
jgi:hypothetical protein